MVTKQEVGNRLRELRGGESREAVAVAIGVTAQAICNYEMGLRTPSDAIKCKIAAYFGKSVQEIFFDQR